MPCLRRKRYSPVITALSKLYPEYNKTCMRVAPAHIGNKLDFIRDILIQVLMRSARAVL